MASATTPSPRHALAAAARAVAPRRIGMEPYLHLVWLAGLAFPPAFDPAATALDWVLVAAAIAVFLPIYLWTWARPGTSASPGILLLGLLGIAVAFVNSGGAVFMIYGAAAAGAKLAPRRAAAAVAALVAAVVVAAVVSGIPLPWVFYAFGMPLVFVPLVGLLNVAHAQRVRGDARLRRAHDEVERLAAIAERERIARDLHDLLGHTLSVIVLKSELASKLAERDTARAISEIREVEAISRRALGEVRDAVRDYRTRGLGGEVAAARAALETAGVRLEVDLPAAVPPPRIEGVLAMVLREAVTNVVRHADASTCTVRVHPSADGWTLEVRDDGHGRLRTSGSGLSGIAERVEALGGDVEVVGGNGVRLVAHVPAGAAS